MISANLQRDVHGWHAHVYYDAETRPKAAVLREAIETHFDIAMGRWRDRPVGPHPMWSYQVAFEPEQFAELVPWLAQHREGLIVLVHPQTGDALIDHRDYPIWLGEHQVLNLDNLVDTSGDPA
jgi:aromatic ring-cleaving dioxygenase